MFGNTATTTSNTGFGGFGNSQQQNKPTAGFGAFGSNTSTAPATSLFGGATNTNTNTSNTGSGFGGFGTSNTPAAPNTSTSTAFGGGSTLFGSSNTTQTGSTNTASPFGGIGASTTTNTFGAAGGLFGSTNKSGTGLFGSSGTTNTTTKPSTSGFGGFGTTNNTAVNTGSSTFSGSSLFGNKQAATGTSLFGNNATTTGFGGGFSSFGKGGLFGTNQQQQQQQNTDLMNQQRAQQVYQLLAQLDQDEKARNRPSITSDDYKPEYVWHALALLKSWWEPSPHCRFRHYFYNVVTPEEVQRYQRPPDHDEAAWNQAQAANPDPTRMVPALAIGFEDIEKRMEEQKKLSEAHKAKLQEVKNILKRITHKSQFETQVRLAEYKQKQMQIVQRTIGLMKYVQVLRNKGLSITADEELMRAKLEDIQEQLDRSEQFHGKLSQLWAQLQLIKESGRKYGKIEGVDGWDTVSEENLKNITRLLEQHDNGIKHLIQVVEDDTTFVDEKINNYKMSDKRYRYL